MANNITVKDGAAADKVLKTTDTAGVHVTHHNLDVIAAGDNNIGNVDIASALPAGTNNIGDVDILSIAAGTNTIGATRDAGPAWTQALKYTTSADATGTIELTVAPTAGQKIVVDDIIVSTDTDMLLTFEEETALTVFMALRAAAGVPVQVTPRGKLKLNTADKKLIMDASAAGNVYVTCLYHSEA